MTKTQNTRHQRDWKKYNSQLKQRASLQIWLSEEVIKGWREKGRRGKRGRPFLYSEKAILFMVAIGSLFHLPLRQTEGFVGSLFEMIGVKLNVPSYTTICRRRVRKGLMEKVRRMVHVEGMGKEGMVLILDSSGLKVMGEGEWRGRGERKRKGWIKVHVAVDGSSKKILNFVVTKENVHESKVFGELIEWVRGSVREVIMDGAYDKRCVWERIRKEEMKGVIKVRRDARKGMNEKRDEVIRWIRERGYDG